MTQSTAPTPARQIDTRHRQSWWIWLCALVALSAVALEYPKIASLIKEGRVYFDDPDDYMRLVRARTLIEQGPQVVRVMSDVNPPAGVNMHWTSPQDFVVAAAGLAARPFVRSGDPLAVGAAWVAPILGFVYILIMMGLLTRTAGRPAAVLGGLLVALTPAWHRVFAFGRPDHHCLLELMFLTSLAGLAPGPRRSFPSPWMVAISGAAIGLAIWVSVQAMLIWVAILSGLLAASWIGPKEITAAWSRTRRTWAVSAAAVVAIGHIAENTPHLNAAALDKISVAHVMFMTLAALMPVPGKPFLTSRANPARPSVLALLPFAIACVGCAAWLFAVRADLLLHMSDPRTFQWHMMLAEFHPLYLHAGGQWSLGKLHASIGYLPYALPVLLAPFTRDSALPTPLRVTCGLFAPVIAVLTIVQLRWLDHFNLFVVPVVAIGLYRIGQASIHPPRRGLMAACVALAALTLPAMKTIVSRTPAGQQSARQLLDRTAHVARVIRDYDRRTPSPGLGTIMTDEADGPPLLYETRRPIIAAPYHRDLPGILESAAFFSERDPIEARRRLDRLGVRYIVVPFRVHEQLYNFETLVFGGTPSFDPPTDTLENGRLKRTPHYRPGFEQTMAYRLAMMQGDPIPGVQLLARALEPGAPTPDHMLGLVYVVEP